MGTLFEKLACKPTVLVGVEPGQWMVFDSDEGIVNVDLDGVVQTRLLLIEADRIGLRNPRLLPKPVVAMTTCAQSIISEGAKQDAFV